MIWEQLGFQSTPYFWEELSANAEGLRLFVGRENESQRFAINAAEPNGATLLVSGPSGVGKTSFVNVNQFLLHVSNHSLYKKIEFDLPKVVPCLRKIQLREQESVESVYLKILSGVIFSIYAFCRENSVVIPKDLQDINDYVTKVVSRSASSSVGVTVLGPGENVSDSRETGTHDSYRFSELTILEQLDNITDVIRTTLGYTGVLVPINNLDIISIPYLNRTLDYLRDSLFTRKHYWWVLLGGTGLHNHLRHHLPRVNAAISGEGIELSPLTYTELEELLEARRKELAIKESDPILPITPRIIHFLYDKSEGDIRFAFHVANEVVRRVFYDFPSITNISEDTAMGQVARITLEALSSGCGSSVEEKMIKYIVANHEIQHFSVEDLIRAGIGVEADIANAIEELVKKRLISRTTMAEKGSLFIPKGYTSLAQAMRVGEYPQLLKEIDKDS